jgi:epoxyqueuosine reductase
MARRPVEAEPVRVSVDDLAAELARLCPERHIDLAGAVTLPGVLQHEDKWWDFVTGDRHAGLDYLIDDPYGRIYPTVKNPWARSLLVFAQRYTNGWPSDDADPSAGGPSGHPDDPWPSRVARYARGLDYHDVLLKDIKNVLKGLQQRWPDLVAFPATDTGPYLERENAWLAGLGFFGKNTCLIHEKLGSGMFLGVAPTNLDVTGLPGIGQPQAEPLYAVTPRRRHEPKRVLASHCGTCTKCLDACPTDALLPDIGMDASRCLSTWTIEWRGKPPQGQESKQGGLLFGCDICQAVCPWNNRAAEAEGPGPVGAEYETQAAHGELKLADLLELNDDVFRERFRRTPLWRAHPAGMRRNAQTVLGNLEKDTKREDPS